MKRTSDGSSAERIEARSPADCIAGPLDSFRVRSDSAATIMASVVLPRPGGPASRIWSALRLSFLAAAMTRESWSTTLCCPTNSLRSLGLRAASSSRSSRSNSLISACLCQAQQEPPSGPPTHRVSHQSPRAPFVPETPQSQAEVALAEPFPSQALRR